MTRLLPTVIYYGRLTNDSQAISNITSPVLGIFGGKDQSISVDSVMQFQKALNDTGITNEIYVYPNVGHAFANPSNDNYAPTETADAWKKTLDFSEQESARLIVDRRTGTFSWTNPKYPIFFQSKFREILTSNTFQAVKFKMLAIFSGLEE